MDDEVRDGLSAVLRNWVSLSDEDARVAMEFVAGEHPGAALIITGPMCSGKSWLANVLRKMNAELELIDLPASDPAMKKVDNGRRTVVIVARELGNALCYTNKREWVEIRREEYKGNFELALKAESLLVEEIEHALGRRTMEEKLTEGVRAWAEQENIRPMDFAKVTGYSYQHAHNLLKGKGQATDETLGRISRTYGAAAVKEILALGRA